MTKYSSNLCSMNFIVVSKALVTEVVGRVARHNFKWLKVQIN